MTERRTKSRPTVTKASARKTEPRSSLPTAASDTEADLTVLESEEPHDVASKDEPREPVSARPRRRRRSEPPAVQDAEPPTAAGAVPVPILIELDPVISGGDILDRFDVTLLGRVISPAIIERVIVETEAGPVASATFDSRGSDIRFTFPDGQTVEQRVFRLTIPCARFAAATSIVIQITAMTVDGSQRSETCGLRIDPTARPPARIVSGPLQTTMELERALAPAVLYVERAAINDAGVLAIDGWAVSTQPVAIIQAHIGDARITNPRMGIERTDVGEAYPNYPNSRMSGFSIGATVSEADRASGTVRVELLCRQGIAIDVIVPLQHVSETHQAASEAIVAATNKFAGLSQQPAYNLSAAFSFSTDTVLSNNWLSTAATPEPEPRASEVDRIVHMFCDEASLARDGILSITGWAFSGAGIARVSVLLDDEPVGIAELGHERPDVASEHPTLPGARFAGFEFTRKVADRIRGMHRLRLVALNMLDDERIEEMPVMATAIPTPPAPPPPPPPVAPPVVVESEPVPEPAHSEVEEFRFQLDAPATSNGAVLEPITGRLTLEGWVLARSGVAALEVFLDSQRLGDAHYGLARQDVGAAFPDWDNSVRSGFAFHCPPRSLRDGRHEVRVVVRAKNGREHIASFDIEVVRSQDLNFAATIRRRLTRVEAEYQEILANSLGVHPRFVVVLTHGGALDTALMTATLQSIRGQIHPDWRLRVLCEDADNADAIGQIIDRVGGQLSYRSSVLSPDSSDWVAPLADDDQALYLMLSQGDELGADALAELALGRGLRPDADFIYTDELRLSPASQEREPFLKPDYSPDLLLSTNYIGRPFAAAGALLKHAKTTPDTLLALGDHDLILRCCEQANAVHHVPLVLCQRNSPPGDDAAKGQAALVAAAERRGIAAEVLPGRLPGYWRFRRTTAAKGKVSVIISTCAAHGYIDTCITTLREKTAYNDYEIVCVDNIPDDQMVWKIWLQQNADKVVDIPDAFNWSRFNNLAADVADGDYILFLNDDIEIEDPFWLDAMLEHAQRPEVGLVGARLLYPDRKIQHAGMFLTNDGIARHAFRFASEHDAGYFGLASVQRNVIAVTGACMLMRRDVFESLGRFDEAHQIINNDLDFCLRAHRAGLLTVLTPHATLIHHELASRDRLRDEYDLSHFNAQWKTLFVAGDPYFNPRLSRHSDDYRPDDEGAEIIHPGYPLFNPDDITNILVVKLDHIGDFITAIPAIRRLKSLFPAARLSVLSGRAVQALDAMEDSIDEFITFEFFHARSGLGQKELTEDDFKALHDQLLPYRFDLAIDLRKQPDTRDVLRHVPTSFRAGFDHLNQFPFLDLSLSWEGDHSLHRKRTHVTDDLVALVELVGTAGQSHRTSLHLPADAADEAIDNLPADARPLFDKPVVAVHPGVGNIMRQWPAGHFAKLIDLLTTRNDVNVVLIGGPDEADLCEEVLASVINQPAVVSLAGRTRLGDLPGLLSRCALYVGNNSGPKHIAAAIGTPTIGIHSGVVDAIEWGPIGRHAIAVRRNMNCSPCYLARPDDCPRGIGCLSGLEPTLIHLSAEAMLSRPVQLPGPAPLPHVDWRARQRPPEPPVPLAEEAVAVTEPAPPAPKRRTRRAAEPTAPVTEAKPGKRRAGRVKA